MVWSDCEGITGDDATCFGETYQIESGILEEIINLNPELEGIIPEEIGKFIMGRVIDIDLSKRGLITLSLPSCVKPVISEIFSPKFIYPAICILQQSGNKKVMNKMKNNSLNRNSAD
ncbi:hypothetical protein EB821_05640 [Candidatus Marinimicrobia bacterium PRS2]|nr:hypothetical protein EB821_05640 [Candidatus Marinimicrobia bacterium PRS2]